MMARPADIVKVFTKCAIQSSQHKLQHWTDRQTDGRTDGGKYDINR